MNSIEWLIEQMQNNIHHTIKIPSEYVEQAKLLHKQEIMNAFDNGFENFFIKESYIMSAEEFYNETFKKD